MEAPVSGLPSSAGVSGVTGTPFSDLFLRVGSSGDKATGFLKKEPALSTLPWPGDSTVFFKGSADRLKLSWQRSPQVSHPQQTFATTSLPRGVSQAWRPLGPTQPAARLGSPGRLCGSLSDLPQGLCWPGAWAPYGSLLCCTAPQPAAESPTPSPTRTPEALTVTPDVYRWMVFAILRLSYLFPYAVFPEVERTLGVTALRFPTL